MSGLTSTPESTRQSTPWTGGGGAWVRNSACAATVWAVSVSSCAPAADGNVAAATASGRGRGELESVLHGLTTTQTGREAAAA